MIQGRDLSDIKFQMNSLDGLRGFAVLIVFLSHTSNEGIFLLPLTNLSGIGKSGVFLFFVLSSFLLTLPFVKKGATADYKNLLLNYSIRRFFRIYPLYFIYLLLGLVTSLTLWKVFDLDTPLGYPFLLSCEDLWGQLLLTKGEGVTWSILVEFRFYFVLPFLALIYSVILKNKLLPSITLTAILITVAEVFWPQSDSLYNDQRLGPYLPIFFMGSFMAVIVHRWQGSAVKNSKNTRIAVELMGLLAAILLVLLIPSVSSFLLQKKIPFNYYHNQFILFGLLWSVVLFACVAGFGILRTFFEISCLRYLGFISFSFYLLHVIVLDLVNKMGASIPLKGWIVLILTVAVSHVSWTFIEKPTSKIKFACTMNQR